MQKLRVFPVLSRFRFAGLPVEPENRKNRFYSNLNPNSDRTAYRFPVEPVRPAGLVRFLKHLWRVVRIFLPLACNMQLSPTQHSNTHKMAGWPCLSNTFSFFLVKGAKRPFYLHNFLAFHPLNFYWSQTGTSLLFKGEIQLPQIWVLTGCITFVVCVV